MEISIAKDFSKKPGLRTEVQTPGTSGEKFRDEVLIANFDLAVEEGARLKVYMDGTNGFSPSFLEEAFGGLARLRGADSVLKNLEIVANEQPYLQEDVLNHIYKVRRNQNGMGLV